MSSLLNMYDCLMDANNGSQGGRLLYDSTGFECLSVCSSMFVDRETRAQGNEAGIERLYITILSGTSVTRMGSAGQYVDQHELVDVAVA